MDVTEIEESTRGEERKINETYELLTRIINKTDGREEQERRQNGV